VPLEVSQIPREPRFVLSALKAVLSLSLV